MGEGVRDQHHPAAVGLFVSAVVLGMASFGLLLSWATVRWPGYRDALDRVEEQPVPSWLWPFAVGLGVGAGVLLVVAIALGNALPRVAEAPFLGRHAAAIPTLVVGGMVVGMSVPIVVATESELRYRPLLFLGVMAVALPFVFRGQGHWGGGGPPG